MAHTGAFEFEATPEIIGERLILRIPDTSDKTAQIFLDAVNRNRSVIREWFSWVDNVTNFAHAKESLERINAKFKNKRNAQYFMYEKENGDFCGMCSFMRYYPLHRRGEIAYWLDNRKQGKGYMSEAISLLENDLFNRGVNRISLHIDTGNEPSEKMAERLGYTLEGTLRDYVYSPQHDGFRNFDIYTKLKMDIKR